MTYITNDLTPFRGIRAVAPVRKETIRDWNMNIDVSGFSS